MPYNSYSKFNKLCFSKHKLITAIDMDTHKKIVKANEFQLVDANGVVRALLTATDDGVSFTLSGTKGDSRIKLSAGNDGLSGLTILDDKGADKIEISLDDKGTHMHLAGEGKQESYIFLKNRGATGLVMTDRQGERRIAVTIGPDDKPHITIFPHDEASKSL